MENKIKIIGAREHNLKNVNLEIPKNKLVVFSGLSGSGKSSLAFDTIYAEGQRRYVESLSSYARQFLGMIEKPDVDQIEGLSPAISIDQKTVSHNPRSTVGTTTEIYDYLRLLFARIGHPHCPNCGREIKAQTPQQIADALYGQAISTKGAKKTGLRMFILAPLVKDRKGEYSTLLDDLAKRGYSRVRIDSQIYNLDEEDITLIKTNRHTIEAVVDRIVLTKTTERSRILDSIEKALKLSGGQTIVSQVDDDSFDFPEKPKVMHDHLYSESFSCPDCNLSLPDSEPRNFSFNNPHGACPVCDGIGSRLEIEPQRTFNENLSIAEGGIFPWSRQIEYESYPRRFLLKIAEKFKFDLNTVIKKIPPDALSEIITEGLIPYLQRRYQETDSDNVRSYIEKFMTRKTCTVCHGSRLKPESLAITIGDLNIAQVSALDMIQLHDWISSFTSLTFTKTETEISAPITKELVTRIQFLLSVGLDYLTLNRSSATLSGGESQRIRLASQIGSGLSGVLYVLDEPSIGLHPRDHSRLLKTLHNLRDLGNTVIIVEHDYDTMMEADWMVDFGPGAGEHGGKIIAEGTPTEISHNENSTTGQFLSFNKKVHPYQHERILDFDRKISLFGARENNLKNVNLDLPLGSFICISGVSGSGKSTLIIDTLHKRLTLDLNQSQAIPGKHDGIEGIANIDKVIEIDQSPIGRTPRSNAATYTGVFTSIREIFATIPESKARGYKLGRFSFNVKGGRCDNCEGDGQNRIAMQFLPDIYVTCEVCKGQRYNRETLDIEYKGKNIATILDMTIEEAYDFFQNIPQIKYKLKTLLEVGLGYIRLGQPAPTLSGGEAQRVKLSSELAKRSTGKTLYILDEPTTGLHFADIDKLLEVLHKLVDHGNTVVVIEHNLDVIKTADWIIDLGPEGGDRGGEVVFTGTVADILKAKNTYTGQHLKKFLEAQKK